MPLSWNEIRSRARAFANEWQGVSEERAEAQSFWNGFFQVFDLNRRRVASFEKPAITDEGGRGRIDLFWKGTLLVEHKSKGRDLDRAYQQGLGYFAGMKAEELPRYVIVSDFERFRLYDLDENEQHTFTLDALPENVHLFGFIAGYQQRKYRDEDPVNIEAAELMGALHDALEAKGYTGRPLETLLVRLLFCFFADDSGVFDKDHFTFFLENHTREDGSDLGAQLNALFGVLDTPPKERQSDLDDDWARFPYVNGDLFRENHRPPFFDRHSRELLMRCSYFDWSRISPAIFGSMFQSAMNPTERRRLGAHYTSEKNVLKLISPLFLDGLRAEFEKAKGSARRLREFHDKLARITCFDPACGCGNFLIIAYRELRLLEIDVLWELARLDGQIDREGRITGQLTVEGLSRIDVDALYGVEIDDFAARIAEVALWLTDHQMNMRLSDRFGQYYARLPLRKSPHIHNANALQTDWAAVLPPDRCSYVLGNPPFIGKQVQSEQQENDMQLVMQAVAGGNSLDYVAAWYVKAAQYMKANHSIRTAFVSTNSITQGEQVSVLWGHLMNEGVKIHFAHRTFKWTNEARGKAAVFCVIVGFGLQEVSPRYIFEYETVTAEPTRFEAKNINPYLIDYNDIFIPKRQKPLCDVPEMIYGNKPAEGGHLLFTDEEKNTLLEKEPKAEKLFRRFMGADEFINGITRWCLWLVDCPPNELRALPIVMERVEGVRKFREASKKVPTQKAAQTPALFTEIRQPDDDFLIVPSVSSERRKYIPIGYFSKDVIVSNLAFVIPNASLFLFGVLTSEMHMAWMRVTCGRLENRFRYSNLLVYNNFPWPPAATEAQRQKVEAAAREVLAARDRHAGSTLADLYDPLAMPPDLVKAHQKLDAAVDACYGRTKFTTEGQRLAFLFDLYRQYAEPLERAAAKGKKKR